ncbi:hypothetical protein ACJRO7_026424 [Eucalyptus globulus]|uniref:Uncharacterized protein n=1 Tax=Eucalyptus globulus TaxID=34317 RepID=A0ABD3K0P5_EUCGL
MVLGKKRGLGTGSKDNPVGSCSSHRSSNVDGTGNPAVQGWNNGARMRNCLARRRGARSRDGQAARSRSPPVQWISGTHRGLDSQGSVRVGSSSSWPRCSGSDGRCRGRSSGSSAVPWLGCGGCSVKSSSQSAGVGR